MSAAGGHGCFVAVDLGATSGRVVLARVGPGRLELEEVHRFANSAVHLPGGGPGGGLHWDVLGLFREVLAGLRGVGPRLADGERVDQHRHRHLGGRLRAPGRRRASCSALPFYYRDERTVARRRRGGARARRGAAPPSCTAQRPAVPAVQHAVPAGRRAGRPDSRPASTPAAPARPARLLAHRRASAPRSPTPRPPGCSTSATRAWDAELVERLGVPAVAAAAAASTRAKCSARYCRTSPPRSACPPPPRWSRSARTTRRPRWSPSPRRTARGVAYISSRHVVAGGRRARRARCSPRDARTANFTNEGGVDGRVRFLRNVMGLWLLTESLRTWHASGIRRRAVGAADRCRSRCPTAGHRRRRRPGVPAARGHARADRGGLPRLRAGAAPWDRQTSSAASSTPSPRPTRRAVADAARLSGPQARDRAHGRRRVAQRPALPRLTAAPTGLPVIAGPVEATALGNALVQARAAGTVKGDLETLRALVRATQPLHRVHPDGAVFPAGTG